MSDARRVTAVAALACLTVVARPARGDDLEALRAENRRLRARIETLEGENARLRTDSSAPLVAALEAHAASAVHLEGEGATAVLTTDPLVLETTSGPRSRHWMWLQARGSAPETVDLVVDAIVSGGAYRDIETLDVDVDGTRERLTVVRHTLQSRTPTRGTPGAGAAGETVTAALPRAALARLARARAADAKLGPTAFRFTPEQLAAFRAFDARLP